MSIGPPQTGQRGYSYRYNCGMAHNIQSYRCLQRLLCLSHHLPVSGIHPVSIERLKHISAVIRVHTVHRWILRKYPVDPQLLIIQSVRLSAQPYHLIFSVHARHRNISITHELRVKILVPCRAEINFHTFKQH